jgi:hypothetical protein
MGYEKTTNTAAPLTDAEKNPTGYQEVKKIVPTVGRVVYYKTRGSADGVFPPTDFASIITKVYSDTCVSLVTFGENGSRFEVKVEQGDQPGQWDWMPFQKGIVR